MTSVQAGDALVKLYRELHQAEINGSIDRVTLRKWARDTRVAGIRQRVKREAIKTECLNGADPVQLDRLEQFAVLLGLRDALLLVNPDENRKAAACLPRTYQILYGSCKLNENCPGALLFRRSNPAIPAPSGNKLSDYIEPIFYVGPDSWNRINIKRIPYGIDIHTTEIMKHGLCVIQFPFIAGKPDLDIRVSRDGNDYYYSTYPHLDTNWQDRVQSVLDAADSSGAHIAVLPEYSLCDEVLSCWIEALAVRPPRGSRLRWVLIGSGPITTHGPSRPNSWPPNRAVLLARKNGKEILTHDKIASFTFDEDQSSKLFTKAAPHHERISEGRVLNVLESEIGRFAILICNDLSGDGSVRRLTTEVGTSHVLVPICTNPINPAEHWVSPRAQDLVFGGSAVAVSNSLYFGRTYTGTIFDRKTDKEKIAIDVELPAVTLYAVAPGEKRRWKAVPLPGGAVSADLAVNKELAIEDATTPRRVSFG